MPSRSSCGGAAAPGEFSNPTRGQKVSVSLFATADAKKNQDMEDQRSTFNTKRMDKNERNNESTMLEQSAIDKV